MESKKKRTFATLAKSNPQRMREIASMGGKTSQARGTAHRWTFEEAQEAGRKGGTISRKRQKEERE